MGPIGVQPRELLPGTDTSREAAEAAGPAESVMSHGNMFTPRDVYEMNLQMEVPRRLIEVADICYPGSQEENHLLRTDKDE